MPPSLPLSLRTDPGAQADDPDVAELDDEPEPTRLPTLATGGQMSWRQQSTTAVFVGIRAGLLRVREMRNTPGGMIHGLMAAAPPSVDEECAEARNRAWVPAGSEDGIAEGMGVVFHVIVGRPGVAVGDTISAIAHKPLRFVLAWLTGLGLLCGSLIALHDYLTAAALAATSMFIGSMWFVAGLIWAAIRNRGTAPARKKAGHPHD
jgi:hypothetical protein